ncbi:MAG: hypothetical protein KAT68_09980 [Bacteroidales bacterium]|nr:hypothetical protein [Bacteroidales bacterium]
MTSNYLNRDFGLNNQGVSNAIESKELPRHRWYYYKEGFSPNLVKAAIKSYNLNSDNLIMDPFNGSGTVTLTASENNIPSIGLEINPFTSFVAKTKVLNSNSKILSELFYKILSEIEKGKVFNELEKYSTFTELSGKDKWLFNLEVVRAFYGGFNYLEVNNSNASNLLKLALLTSVMENSNAKKDGKCLRYKNNWQSLQYSKNSLIESFINNYQKIETDIKNTVIKQRSKIIQTDSRHIDKISDKKFDLVVTSPPYLNTFDYTDIYRPELFLGKFVLSSRALYKLRLKTIRSHIQAKWKMPDIKNIESIMLKEFYQHLKSNGNLLMHPRIPMMILAYFEDMKKVFNQLSLKVNKNAHLWMIVSNSAYANVEIPVDLILADIATKSGWKLNEIGVLREITKRKTKYSPDIKKLRESVIILEKR